MESPRVVGVEAVTVACLDALEMLEKHADDEEPLRQRYPSTGALARALYRALRALHEREAGSASTLAYVLACARAARDALEDLRTRRSNFFGAEFRDRSPLSTLRNVERKVSQLAESLSGAPAAESGSCYVGGALGDDDAELAVADVPSRLFWIERFGRFSSEVPWAQFTASVVDEFGEQPRGTLELLKPALGVRDAAGFVSMAAFGRFAEHRGRGGGFYGAFVALSDPARVVYAMGTVDDDAQGGEPAPALVEGLLGVAVAAVCCGGQHAAVLTAAGEVYTWGRGGFGRLGHGDAHSLKAPRLVRGALVGVVCAQVACGFAYTAAVSAQGALYTWGAGENGRLGLGDVDDRHEPSRVDALWPHRPLRRVNAGSVHTCALGVDGVAYSFGKHEYTGHGAAADVLTPRPLDGAFGGRAEVESSTRLQCERTRQFRRTRFGFPSRTRREPSIRPKISRIDLDVAEREHSEVSSGPPEPAVEFGAGSAAARSARSPSGRAATTRWPSCRPPTSTPGATTASASSATRTTTSCRATARARTSCRGRGASTPCPGSACAASSRAGATRRC